MAAAKKPAKKRTVTDEHKAAMQQGRRAAAAVGAYVEATESTKPQRRRKLTPEQIEGDLVDARAAVDNATGTKKLAAAQHVIDLERRLIEATVPGPDLDALEEAFVEWAPVYAENKGISYDAFRAVGVPAAVLKRAGISR
jgi:hypothetical protein